MALPRGKLLRTKIRERKALVKADLQAKKEWEERKANIPHLLKKQVIELLHNVDPIKMIAWGSATIIIYTILEKSTEIVQKLEEGQFEMPEEYRDFPELVKKWEAERDRPSVVTHFVDMMKPLATKPMLLMMSLVMGYILIEHPDMILSSLTGISKLALGLLA